MRDDLRARFDDLLDDVVANLPGRVHDLLDEVPIIVDDEPPEPVLRDLVNEWSHEGVTAEALRDELCGLHTGVPLTERSVEAAADLPEEIRLFRRGIVTHAGGWDVPDAIREEIRITVLHEIGHHFGLDEDDLAELGYE